MLQEQFTAYYNVEQASLLAAEEVEAHQLVPCIKQCDC